MKDEIKRPNVETVTIQLLDFNRVCKINSKVLPDYFDDKGMLSSEFCKYNCSGLKEEATYHFKGELYKHELDIDKCLDTILSNYTFEVDTSGLFEPICYWKVFSKRKVELLSIEEFADYCRIRRLIASTKGITPEDSMTNIRLVDITTGKEVARAKLESIFKNEVRFIFKPQCNGLRDLTFYKQPQELKPIGEC